MEVNVDDIDEYLEHFGVKGQKWGVRREEKRVAKADKKFEKGLNTSTYFKVYNQMADRLNNGEIDRINNDPRFKDRSFTDENHPITKAYYKEYADTATRLLNEASASIIGTNASGTRKVQFDYVPTEETFPRWNIVDTGSVTHADENVYKLDVKYDDNGMILEINVPEDLFQSGLNVAEEILSHFGIKGMRWGVTRKNPSRTPSADAKRHASSRKKHISELDDKELRDYLNRLNMEQQYSKLNPSAVKKGEKVVKEILAVTATAGAAAKVLSSPGAKAAAKGAVRATIKALHKPAQALLVKSLSG